MFKFFVFHNIALIYEVYEHELYKAFKDKQIPEPELSILGNNY